MSAPQTSPDKQRHQRGGLPVAAQQLASGGARAHAGDAVVLFGFHGVCNRRRRGANDNSESTRHQRDHLCGRDNALR